MKLYFFDPCTWGQHYTIMADNREQAIQKLKDYFKEDPYNYGREFMDDEEINVMNDIMNNVNPDGVNRKGYCLKEFEAGHVIHGEFA